MTRMIFCTRLQKEAEGLRFQLYPGELGKRIFDHISQQAWSEWQQKQTMLLNEKKLNMMDEKDRLYLEQEMVKYLFEGEDIIIDGYTPKA